MPRRSRSCSGILISRREANKFDGGLEIGSMFWVDLEWVVLCYGWEKCEEC